MPKEVQVWLRDNEESGMLVYPDDIEKKYNFCNCNFVKFPSVAAELPSVAAENISNLIEGLNKALSGLDESLCLDDIEEFLKNNGINAKYEHCNDLENTVNCSVLAFDICAHEFFNLYNCDEMDVYQYWDGSNWKTVWADDCSVEYYSISENKVCLDEWDGRNLVTGGIGEHQYVYKVYQEAGEKVEDKYFVVFSSQWQGVQDSAKIMNAEALREHLKEINRDADYIDLCKAIEA